MSNDAAGIKTRVAKPTQVMRQSPLAIPNIHDLPLRIRSQFAMPRRGLIRAPLTATGELGVVEHRCDNGLHVLIVPLRQAPIAVCDLHFRAGSVDDPAGKSGLAHVVEHMLFQGTARYPKGRIDLLTFLAGGSTNAETGEDYTHYWFALPSQQWQLELEIDADRLANTRFDPVEFEREQRVIVEERARELDSAAGRLEEAHIALSYLSHPYRTPIFGWLGELRALTVDDAQTWFESHYGPDSALLVVVGDVDPARVIDRATATLGALPRRQALPRRPEPLEPPQTGRRSFVVERAEGLSRGLLGWHTVPRGHPDGPALDVLADLLSGGTSARLKHRLVDRRRLAVWASASQEAGRMAGQFLIRVDAASGVAPARIEADVLAELRALARHGPELDELARCRQRLESAWRWEQQDTAGLAAGLGAVALWQDWRAWPAEHRAAMKVTAEDISRVAERYFHEDQLTVGWTRPRGRIVQTGSEMGESAAATHAPAGESPILLDAKELRRAIEQPKPRPISLQIASLTLPNGLRVLSERHPGCGTLAIELYCDAGLLRESAPGVAYLTARLRDELRDRATGSRLIEPLEDSGGQVEFLQTGVSIRARSEDLLTALDLIVASMIVPSFDAGSLARVRARVSDELRGDLDDGVVRAGRAFIKRVYGTHPLGRDVRGSIASLAAMRIADVRDHQERWIVPNRSFLVVVGDFHPPDLVGALATRLGRWKPSGIAAPPLPPVRTTHAGGSITLSRAGEQAHIFMGHIGIARRDPDYAALAVLDHILGSGPGFVDRLSRVLRDEMGLAYAVGGGMTDSADVLPGVLRVYAGTNPADAGRARNALRGQLIELQAGRFSDEEVIAAREYLARSSVFEYQNTGARAERILEIERWGLTPAESVGWPQLVESTTPEQVRAAAARHIRPAQLVEISLGA